MTKQKSDYRFTPAHAAGAPTSSARRNFMAFAGATAGATLLSALPGCGGGSGSSSGTSAAASGGTTPVSVDLIWGTTGAAQQIIDAPQHITPSMFPSVDYVVMSYGAQPLSSQVVAAATWNPAIPCWARRPHPRARVPTRWFPRRLPARNTTRAKRSTMRSSPPTRRARGRARGKLVLRRAHRTAWQCQFSI